MTVSDDLRNVSKHLDESGWCQKMLEDSEGSLCLLGGFKAVSDSYDSSVAFQQWLVLQEDVPGSISHFNDQPGMTLEVVQATLEEAANYFEKETK